MDNPALSFEEILNATIRLLRHTWKAQACIFLQVDDHGELRVRAADGISLSQAAAVAVKTSEGSFSKCISENKMMVAENAVSLGSLAPLIPADFKSGDKFILSPVTGETRVLGVLVLGPYSAQSEAHPQESDLRSAGALCAVLSAHWRMYEWMASFVPQLNHELRTPLTTVQGTIGMVLGGMFGEVGKEVKVMLEMAQEGCERTVRAIEDYVKAPKASKDKDANSK